VNAESALPGRFGRRRRANAAVARSHSHQVKVTPEEEGQLLIRAGQLNVTIPRLLVESALSSTPGETASDRRQVIAELFAVHRLLAAVSNNVNQMAKVTNATGQVHAELRATLDAVRRVAERVDVAVDRLAQP
jgi:hypothetical protein